MHLRKELDLARSAAMHAGELALGYQSRSIVAEEKPDLSPVTAADRECERLIVSRIAKEFPDDGILGEEGASRESRNGRLWIIDPIDGTRDFVRGLPLWANMIALEVDGEVALGVVNMAPRREMYSAVGGQGAWLNDSPVRISSITKAASALVSVTALNNCSAMPFADRLLPWLRQFWAVRSMGGCYDAMLLASGKAEVWIEPHAYPWDFAPIKVILEEAGARFFNFDGGSSIRVHNGVACVPALEPVVRELIGLPVER